MRKLLACLLLLTFAAAPAFADELDDRAKILSAEMRRDAAELHPYLKMKPGSKLRLLAIRALGRIGNDGTGPGIIRDTLSTGDPDLRDWLWAAGIARTAALAEPLKAQLLTQIKAEQWDLAAQAARSLGWTGAKGIDEALMPLLSHPQAAIRAAALEGLGRAGVSDGEPLERASKLAADKDTDVRIAAEFACWLMAGMFRAEVTKRNETWDGHPEVAKRFLPHLKDTHPDRRMGGIRVLGSLMPKTCTPDGPFGAVFALIDDKDPRVVQDAIRRIFGRREGEHVDAALVKALGHADAKVRHMAAEALGKHGTPVCVAALAARWEAEPDARVREVLTVELARNEKDEFYKKLAARKDRPKDEVVQQLTDANVLLVSKRKEALDELLDWADPGASQRAGLHAAAWMQVLSGLKGRDHPKLDDWLIGFLEGGYGVDKVERHFVISSAVDLVGSNKRHKLGGTLLGMLKRASAGLPHDEIKQNALHEEIRRSVMSAMAALAADEGSSKEQAAAMRAAIQRHMTDDPSPWVRRAARAAATKLGVKDVPKYDESGQSNTWKGLPRFDPESGEITGWMTEKEILQQADWIATHDPLIVFETTAGSFSVKLDPAAAPVHCVSLLLGVRAGVYTDTRWHRVVPCFVIQGGDPHGHGGGDAGWVLPDEISENRYLRGAMGMPKNIKDDGGGQVFVMHTTYRPLDERYTCYGTVVSGMDSVDRIRVGDFITAAKVQKRPR